MKLSQAIAAAKAAGVQVSDIEAGTKARKAVPFSMGDGAPQLHVNDAGQLVPTDGAGVVLVDVRVLDILEEAQCAADARSFAKAQGVDDPREGNPIYDYALMVHVVVRATIDHDSPADKPEPFFDGGATQAWKLDRERIAMLYEHQASWQAACSPRKLNLSEGEFLGFVTSLVVDDSDAPFDSLPLATVRNSMRTLARLWLGSQPAK